MRLTLVYFTAAVAALTCGFRGSSARSDTEVVCVVGATNIDSSAIPDYVNYNLGNFHILPLNTNSSGVKSTKSSLDQICLSGPIVTRDITSSRMSTIPISDIGFSPSRMEQPMMFSDSHGVTFDYDFYFNDPGPIIFADSDNTQFSQFSSTTTLSILWPP
ncbi:MAG TPA: hypothetical protein VMG59_13435 [Phycisphaerae bacterium]|nr:hypothetical protein [Phycisphaerae bacterium]